MKLILSFCLAFTLSAGLALGQTSQLNGAPVRFGPSLPSTCSPNQKTSVLFYKTGADNGLYLCLTLDSWTAIGSAVISSGPSLSVTYSNDLAAAVSAIGATPTMLRVTQNAVVSTSITVPPTLVLVFENQAKLVESGTATITFQGVGISNPEAPIAIFSNFEPGDITWSGTTPATRPFAIAGELWDTGTDSVTDRLDRADDSVADGQQLKIVLHPRPLTGPVVLRSRRELYFTSGDYLNTATHNYALLVFDDYTWFHGAPGARLHEGNPNMYFIGAPDNTSAFEQIRVEDLTFVGDPAASNAIFNGAGSTVQLGNAKNSWIRRCLFYKTHAYAAFLGAFGPDNYAENSDISDNVFVGIGTQVAGFINAVNCRISRNFFDQRGANGAASYTVLDAEPNGDASRIENIVIENNVIDLRDPDTAGVSKVAFGILLQGSLQGAIKNATIRNNIVYGREFNTAPTSIGVTVGVQAYGVQELSIHNNHIRSAYQRGGINVSVSEYVSIRDNEIVQSTGGQGPNYGLWLEGVATANVDRNTLLKAYLEPAFGYGSTAIYENEAIYVATVSGATITVLPMEFRLYSFYAGKTVTFNNTDYTVTAWTSGQTMDVSPSIGAYPAKTFDAAAAVNAGTDTISLASHGYNTGAFVRYDHSAGAAIGGLVGGNYYLISTGSGTFKLATTMANALAGTAVDITLAGSGNHTIYGLLQTKFSNNTYSANNASFLRW